MFFKEFAEVLTNLQYNQFEQPSHPSTGSIFELY